MVVQDRIRRPQFDGALEVLHRLGVVAETEVRPAEAVDDVAIVGFELNRLLDELQALLEAHVPVDPGVAEVVQDQRLVGVEFVGEQQIAFGARPVLDALVGRPARIPIRPVVRLRFARHVDDIVVVLDRLFIALAAAQHARHRLERAQVVGVVADQVLEDGEPLVRSLLTVEVVGTTDLDEELERGARRNPVVDRIGALELLVRLIDVGEGREGEVEIRLKEQRHLEVDRAELQAALGRQGLAEAVVDFRKPGGRVGDEQRQAPALTHLVGHGGNRGMQGTAGRLAILLEDRLGECEFSRRGGVMQVRDRDAGHARVGLEDASEVLAGQRGLPGQVGNQRAMVAEIVLRPLRTLRVLEVRQRKLGAATALGHPGARQCTRQLTDGARRRLVEVAIGGAELTRLEGRDTQPRPG